MNKYIRTKDKIIDVTSPYWGKDERGYYTYLTDNPCEPKTYIHKEDIIKESNTIDELCDMFYLDRGGDIDINEFYDKYQFDVAKENYLEEIRHFIPIKLQAYIKTDKGLICVAQMNEKVDLELI